MCLTNIVKLDAPALSDILIKRSGDPNSGVLKIRKRFLNFALLPSASQQWAPVFIIQIGLLFMEVFNP